MADDREYLDILVNVVNQKLKIATNLKEIVAGTKNFVKFTFNLPDEWKEFCDGTHLVVQFKQGDTKTDIPVSADDQSVFLPTTITTGNCTMMLRGGAGSYIAVSDTLTLNIKENPYGGKGDTYIPTEGYSSVETAVKDQIEKLISDGELAGMTVTDGSITRKKVDSDFESTLKKADSAMQASTYDTSNRKTDVFNYVDRKVTDIQKEINSSVSQSKSYTDDKLSKYKAYKIIFVDELPSEGEDMTFYLLPSKSGDGYDKYWWITDEDNQGSWDAFGGTSTLVVTELPAEGKEDIDYILKSSSGCLYYKWIEGKWEVVAGSIASVVSQLPENGNEFTDYYLLNENNLYVHYRYIDGSFHIVGSDSYTKDEMDVKIADLESKQANDINVIDAKVDALGNLVSDITESDNGIKVHFKDGSSKTVDTKDTTITVEDVDKIESGIKITYSDGDTKEIEISGGGGSSTSGSATITRITDASTQCIYGDDCLISFSFDARDSSGDTTGDGSATWYVNDVKKTTGIVHQGENAFNVGDYLSVGQNNIKVVISVETGGDTPAIVKKTWTVSAINMYAVWDYDDTTINNSDTAIIRWTPYGGESLSKTMHILVDGVEVATKTTTRSGAEQNATISKYPHGSHMAELYLTATVNGQEIRSNSIFHDMIFVDSGNTTPVIASPIANATITQYNTLQIPIVVYNPKSLTANVTLAVNGVNVASWEDVDRTVHYWNYTPNDFGVKSLTITCGDTVKTISVNVEKLDINNEEIPNYAFKLKASDIAGNDALRTWNSNDIGISFSENFDWNNGGIQTETDENGNLRQYICVKAGTTMTIGYSLFGDDARTNGKSFKVIFKATNSRDYDASFLNCIANGIGISLGANEGTISSEQNTVSVQYAEDSYVEFEFDVHKAAEYRYLQTYLDGVISSTIVYATDDNFTQIDKQNITIGSADCDVYIYMVKAYESSLSLDNHIENFIADAPNAQEMVARYNRNDVLLDAGATGTLTAISYSKLATQAPEARVHLWDIPRMTEGKKDYVDDCSYQQIYTNGDQRHQITADGVRMSIQGTSSVNYKESAANTDGDFLNGFDDGNGNHLDTYSMTDNSIGVNYFNTKVNVASCENINNMCLAEWYNRYQPYKTLWRQKNALGRDCMELHMGVQFIKDQSHGLFNDDEYHMYAICNMGNSKKNSAVFHDASNPNECCIETKDNNSKYCLMTPNYNSSDEKVPFDVTQLDSEDFFEFRYPESPTSEMKNAFIQFVEWMTESNPALATDETLPSSVTYGAYTFKGHGNGSDEILAGTTIDTYAGTYTKDTYEYRMAKMLSECEEHLIMDAMVYHYVFVEEHTMVDNVCKNTFWTTEDLKHWSLCKNYDNDTADGNDNNGKLIVPFGCEGMDMLTDTRDVFNGKSAVWWVFIHGLYKARQTMWLNRETAGAWDKDAYLAHVKKYQDILPERVWNQDYWYKYLRLYEQKEVTTYLDMLEGGKKTHQREAFVTNNMYYMASQYIGTACTSKSITMRGYTPTIWLGVEPKSEVTVMMYNKGYIVVQIGSIYKQLKADKGKYYTISFSDSGDMNDTVINIHGANLVQAIGDISCLYVGRTDFAGATRLRSIQIGSMETGYSNPNLTEVSFGTNKMLEYLYIQNCPNVKESLDLTGCQALRELDIRGSGFTGVSFATGGLIEKAYLCSPASLNMRSLYNLKDEHLSLESYDKLTSLRLEDCNGIDSLALVAKAVNLARIRLLDIDWTLADTSILNKMLNMLGLNEENFNVDHSVLTGSVYVSGSVRNQELTNYNTTWENLKISYNPDNLVTQYLVKYINADDKSTVLYTTYVDAGSTPPDPYAEGWIEKPTLESDAECDYSFGTEVDGEYVSKSGWSDEINDQVLVDNKVITAKYTKNKRRYTVTWYSREGSSLGSVEADYGDDVVYNGETPTEKGSAATYKVFAGWNNSTGFIKGDTDVYAIWETAQLPDKSQGLSLEKMTPGQIFAVTTSKGNNGITNAENYFEDGDYVDITLGHDFDFENVESKVLVAEDKYFDGTDSIDTEIKLFDENERSFTLAIDFRFIDLTADSTLLSCYKEDGSEGFRLRINSSTPNIQWGDVNCNVGYQGYRDMVVLRHTKGDNNLYVYCSNGNTKIFADNIVETTLTRSRSIDDGQNLSLKLGECKGYIYWSKIWYDDLGETNARKLAAWTHEPVRVEYYGAGRYALANDDSQTCNASFIFHDLLSDRLRAMNPDSTTNEDGWSGSSMRTFLNNRLPLALPTVWRSMLKQVQIKTFEPNSRVSTETTNDYFYLPSYTEMGGTTSNNNEGTCIGWMTNRIYRIKNTGLLVSSEYKTEYYYESEETTPPESNIHSGDRWTQKATYNNTGGYIYATNEDISKLDLSHYGNYGKKIEVSGGCWLLLQSWLLRTPGNGDSTSFYRINQSASVVAGTATTLAQGVCPCFSI